jgi:hypothetical protein
VTIQRTLVDRNTEDGMFIGGSDVTIESTLVRDTQPSSDLASGRGLEIVFDHRTDQRASAILRWSLVDSCSDVGILVAGSHAVVEGTAVRATAVRASDGLFGDAVDVVAQYAPAVAHITGSYAGSSARAGVVSFGADIALGASVLHCNLIDLCAQHFLASEPSFVDLGDNMCGCGAETTACQLISSNLEPPVVAED